MKLTKVKSLLILLHLSVGCNAYASTNLSALEQAASKGDVVGVRLENGNFPTLSVLSLTSDFVPLSANP